MGAAFFGMAAWLRSMRPVYVVSVLMLVGYLIAGVLLAKIENKTLASVLDPFGLIAFGQLTEYWTVAEKNRDLVPLAGVLLANRIVWMAVGTLVLALASHRFRFAHHAEGAGRAAEEANAPEAAVVDVAPEPVRPLSLFPRLAWLAARETVKNVYFLVIVLGGVLFVIVGALLSGSSTTPAPIR
jgi:hypothetical protein